MPNTPATIFITLLLWLFSACITQENEEQAITSQPSGPGVKYAKNFSIEKRGEHTILEVNTPWKGTKTVFRYLTYPRGSEAPAQEEGTILVPVPVRSLAVMSTTHVGLLGFLDSEKLITSMSGTNFIYHPGLQGAIKEGTIKELGFGEELNYELLLETAPDIVLTYGISEDNNIQKLKEVGLKPVVVAEYMDNSPLARAEWVKFVAVLTGQEAKAKRKFEEAAQAYEHLKKLAKATSHKPSVFTGMGFEGNWHVPEADSYVAQSIADAGGNYLWKDNPGKGSISLDFEAFFVKAQEADVWINVGMVKSLSDIHSSDERYGKFKAWQDGRVYNGNARVSPGGGYDIYESAVVNPQLVLEDLIQVFHPDLLPEAELTYYTQLK